MKKYNIIGKNNDMVIIISGENKVNVIDEIYDTIQSKAYYIEEVTE